MKTLANFAGGAVVAAMLLVPAVRADASRLIGGNAPMAQATFVSIGGSVVAVNGTLPRLLGRLFAQIAATQAAVR
jgi:hypothetical protein